jgi:hypothetical protein
MLPDKELCIHALVSTCYVNAKGRVILNLRPNTRRHTAQHNGVIHSVKYNILRCFKVYETSVVDDGNFAYVVGMLSSKISPISPPSMLVKSSVAAAPSCLLYDNCVLR